MNDREFSFQTTYDSKALTAMSRALRKTLRKKRSHRTRIFSVILIILIGLMLVIPLIGGTFVLDGPTVLMTVIMLILLCLLIFEDRVNGWFAKKHMLKGAEQPASTFREDGYQSVTAAGTTQWSYDNIAMLAETGDYFMFLFLPSHAQIYDKASLTGGTVEEFRTFIQEKTGKSVQQVK